MKIPCLDLKGQHQQIKTEIFEQFEKVYENTAFSGGPFVENIENDFAEFFPMAFYLIPMLPVPAALFLLQSAPSHFLCASGLAQSSRCLFPPTLPLRIACSHALGLPLIHLSEPTTRTPSA